MNRVRCRGILTILYCYNVFQKVCVGPDGSFVSTGTCNLDVRIPVGLDICLTKMGLHNKPNLAEIYRTDRSSSKKKNVLDIFHIFKYTRVFA